MNNYYVYIISNWNNKVLYIGVTNNLERRIYEHKNKLFDGFSKKYNLSKLVYFEKTNEINSAIVREKEIKKWRREKKNKLIESLNPSWVDLFENDKAKIFQSSEKDALVRNDKPKICGLLIAAGLSSRMSKFKPLLVWNHKTFLSNVVDNLKIVCNEIIIVTGYNSEMINELVENYYKSNEQQIKIVLNPHYEMGMFSSIKKGIDATQNNDWVLFHQVDQPNLPVEFYHEFVNEIDINYDWIQPQFNERKGHPILFNRNVIELIKKENMEGSLRSVSNSILIRKKIWATSFNQILTDIDTPEDIKKMKGE